MTVRPARPEDLAAIEAIDAAVFDGDRRARQSLRYFIRSKTTLFLVLSVSRRVSGYSLVAFRKGSSRAKLYTLALDPCAHGRGFGRALLGAAERAAKARGATLMRLEVRVDNDRAIQLYEKNGYRRFGTIEDYYGDGATALRLEKQLIQADDKGLAPRSSSLV